MICSATILVVWFVGQGVDRGRLTSWLIAVALTEVCIVGVAWWGSRDPVRRMPATNVVTAAVRRRCSACARLLSVWGGVPDGRPDVALMYQLWVCGTAAASMAIAGAMTRAFVTSTGVDERRQRRADRDRARRRAPHARARRRDVPRGAHVLSPRCAQRDARRGHERTDGAAPARRARRGERRAQPRGDARPAHRHREPAPHHRRAGGRARTDRQGHRRDRRAVRRPRRVQGRQRHLRPRGR